MMDVNRQILSLLLEADAIPEDFGHKGVATLARDEGYETLSAARKSLLRPYLSRHCAGYVDHAGEHVACRRVLEGEELLAAHKVQTFVDEFVQCEACQGEAAIVEHDKQKYR